ncbi:MAG: hypothetical protein Q9209_006510 [Squamulea sp. 1 TL-2023]
MAPTTVVEADRLLCESDTPLPSPNGCCADGRSCDDICIHVAAAYECQTTCGPNGNLELSAAEGDVDDLYKDSNCMPVRQTCGEDDGVSSGCNHSATSAISKIGGSVEEQPEPHGQVGCYAITRCIDDEISHDRRENNVKAQPQVKSQDKCCVSELGNGTDKSTVGEAQLSCQDTCCTTDEQAKVPHLLTRSEQDEDAYCGSPGRTPGKACGSHLEAAFEKYASYLKLGRCICRSVLAPIETCCSKERRARAMQSGRLAKRRSTISITPLKKQDGKNLDATFTSIDRAKPADRSGVSTALRKEVGPIMTTSEDVEMGRLDEATFVSITISGMTCTGCSKKGVNVLSRIPGVADARINFVASTGEFKLESHLNASEVISQFERETGFKCARITKDFQILEVIMSSSEATLLESNLPFGIDTISRIDKESYEISFDPTVIGARSVFANISSRTLAAPRNDSTFVSDKGRLIRMAWNTILATLLTVPVVVLAWSNAPASYSTRSITSLVLATCVQAIAVPEFYSKAIKALIFSKVIELDMLVVIAVSAAYGYSVVAFGLTHRGYNLEQGEFFETSTLLITLVLVGRLISVIARMKALTAVSMKSMQAEVALLVGQFGGTSEIDARLLEYGDTVRIPPHAKVVTDGEVISGFGAVDESLMTGECIPISKKRGDSVIAGTMNGSSSLTIRLTRLPGQNSITDIANLVEGALGKKPYVQDLADRVAGWFVPAVVGISCVVFAIWVGIGIRIHKQDAGGTVGLAITYGIAVLAISCPCALGLAVPMVLIIAGGIAAKSGIVIKSASATEGAYKTTDVVFDKTGTLTSGVLEVLVEEYFDASLGVGEIKSVVLALLKDNHHPVSSAVAKALQSQQVTATVLEGVQSIPGAGLEATWKGKSVKAGNPYYLELQIRSEIYPNIQRGMTMLCVTIESILVAAYGLRSEPRPEAEAIIQNLQRHNITCHIVSGDGIQVVETVARKVGIDLQNIAARQSPCGKQEYVEKLMDKGKTVLFCGDGTNDAIAVAQAHIGVQIGSTSDIMQATADVVLTGGLDGILALLSISRQAYIRIVFNFVWSALYNIFAILLAAGAFVKVRIPPAYAGLGELVSVLPVIVVAMSMMWLKRKSVEWTP